MRIEMDCEGLNGGEECAHYESEKCGSMGAFGASDPWGGLKGIGRAFLGLKMRVRCSQNLTDSNRNCWGVYVDLVGICVPVAAFLRIFAPENARVRIFAPENPPRAFLRLKMREGT